MRILFNSKEALNTKIIIHSLKSFSTLTIKQTQNEYNISLNAKIDSKPISISDLVTK